jgi:hypothetical protein
VNLNQLGSVARTRWFNMATGAYSETTGSPFVNDGTRSLTPPSSSDWMLLLEALDPGMPGTWVGY